MKITDLDCVKLCEQPFEFEYIPDETGIKSGIFLSVKGAHADSVKRWTRIALNKMREREAMLARKSKNSEYRSVEEDEEFSIQLAAVRLVGWRGIEDEFNKENAELLCRVHPGIRNQIIQESDNLGNFTPSK